MRIGILTYHSQLNYGGILQAFALRTYLTNCGHEVQIIDRWLDKENLNLLQYSTSERKSLRFNILRLLGTGRGARCQRVSRTLAFIKKYLNLTYYHFFHWQEISAEKIKFDLIVVGSDQVWNCTGWDISPYLLTGLKLNIPAISYAASFGMKKIPSEKKDFFLKGLSRFNSISVREKEGVEILADLFFQATHVVDPVLLLSKKEWETAMSFKIAEKNKLVCYFLSEDIEKSFPLLEAFSRQNRCRVEVFVNEFIMPISPDFRSLFHHLKKLVSLSCGNVKLCLASGPDDFIKSMSSAKWIISDSFHALMFATIFQKNIRMIFPTNWRIEMFSRIQEWAQAYINGNVIVKNLGEAFNNFNEGNTISYNIESLDIRINFSKKWLESAIKEATQRK